MEVLSCIANATHYSRFREAGPLRSLDELGLGLGSFGTEPFAGVNVRGYGVICKLYGKIP